MVWVPRYCVGNSGAGPPQPALTPAVELQPISNGATLVVFIASPTVDGAIRMPRSVEDIRSESRHRYGRLLTKEPPSSDQNPPKGRINPWRVTCNARIASFGGGVVSKLLRGAVAGWGATKLGGGCLTTVLVFALLWWLLGNFQIFQ
jgi:hypothetical protein